MHARGSNSRTCPMSANPILQFEQLVLSRGKQRVAGPLDLSLMAGERGLVSGANGSGKTTLVLAIAGLIKPTSGRLERPARIGLVPQEPDFPLHLSCHSYFQQLLGLGGRDHSSGSTTNKSTSSNQQLSQALQLFGLEDVAKRPIGELSRGWRQRLNLARGWLSEPSLLILDEPQTALDPDGMAALTAALASLRQTAVLIVAPAGVGCQNLAPLVLDLSGGRV